MAPVDARDGGGAGRERAGVGVPAVGVPVDRIGLEVLDRQTCLELLATAPIGRVGLSIEALPVVLPVAGKRVMFGRNMLPYWSTSVVL